VSTLGATDSSSKESESGFRGTEERRAKMKNSTDAAEEVSESKSPTGGVSSATVGIAGSGVFGGIRERTLK